MLRRIAVDRLRRARPDVTWPLTWLRPRPVIDVHTHLGTDFHGQGAVFSGRWSAAPTEELVSVMDRANVEAVVNLDGGSGPSLAAQCDRYVHRYPGRFVVFANLDGETFSADADFGGSHASRLVESARIGARGLKVWKDLGLSLRDHQGRLIPFNDRRLDAVWETAASLALPVMVHVADPPDFFRPIRGNPRAGELRSHPDWHYYPTRPRGRQDADGYPPFEELMDQLADVVVRHRGTTFIGAHLGCNAEDLGWVGAMLDRCPNFYVDTAGRVPELAQQRELARIFMVRYQDRIMLGTDTPPSVTAYFGQRWFYESDSYCLIPRHAGGRPMLARGLGLPDEVLDKLFADNARRLLSLA